jgi:hypothetical protein
MSAIRIRIGRELRYLRILPLLVVVASTACSGRKGGAETPEVVREATLTPTAVAEQRVATPESTFTPYPTYTAYPTFTPPSTRTATLAATPTATLTATEITPSATVAVGPGESRTEVPTEAAARPSSQTVPLNTPAPPSVPASGPTRREDPDPGPPFTVFVSRARAGPDGYKITGTVRNDSPQTFERIGVIATFFGEGGLWYGPVDADLACLFLEPSASCPFSLKALPADYVEYFLHPEGRPVEYRRPASLALSNLHITNDGIGNVRVTGVVVNQNPFVVSNPVIAGALLDASGQFVSLGSTLLPGDVEAGANVPFDLRIEYEPYAHYQLYAQGVRN